MRQFRFIPQMFIVDNHSVVSIEHAARIANDELRRWRERQPMADTCMHKRTQITEPHLAGARECLDCGMTYNPNRSPAWQKECEHEVMVATMVNPKTFEVTIHYENARCGKCGARLKATWSVAEEK